jgi:hypothetical protein
LDQKPSKGRIVLVTTPGRKFNESIEHAAIITDVHGDAPHWCISTKIFPSGTWPTESVTSIVFADPPSENQPTWRWPPRV